MRDASEADIDAWMARLAAGERDAFDPLFRALYPRAIRFARAASPDAEDLAQAVMTRLFARAHEFEPGRAVLPWFYAIALNEARGARRRGAREVPSDPLVLASRDDASPDDPLRALARAELARALELAIATLDRPSADAIAVALGKAPPSDLAPATHRKRLSRAYARLRLILGGSHGR